MTSGTPDPRWALALALAPHPTAARRAPPQHRKPVGATPTVFVRAPRLLGPNQVVKRALSHSACEGKDRAARPIDGAVAVPADVLTRDNPHLSRPKTTPLDGPDSTSNETPSAPSEDQAIAIDQFVQLLARMPTPERTLEEVAPLVESSIADNIQPIRPDPIGRGCVACRQGERPRHHVDPTGFSGDSPGIGFATSAVQTGVSTIKIR
jgi:hypothetical protein